MIFLKSILDVADNTGARKASFIGVLNAKGKNWAQVGDVIKVNIKQAAPDSAIKKGEMAKGVVGHDRGWLP